MSASRRLLAAAALATGSAAAAAAAANFGVAAHRYGFEYLRRLALWGRREDMRDPERFPARAIAPSDAPFRFAVDPAGPANLEAAFEAVAARHGAGGEAFEAFLARTRTTSLLVLADDRLAYERYFNGATREDPLTSMSMSKSALALLAAAAVADGAVPSFDTPAEALLPEVEGLKGSGVTLRHLMRMSSGLRFESPWPLHRLSWPLLFDGGRVAYFTPDIRAYVATARPGSPPGARFAYDDRGVQLVGMMLERAVRGTVSEAFGARLWRRIGAEYPASWNLDSEKNGFEKMESGLNAAALDWLKLGRLVMRDGVWEGGRAVLPASLLREATTPARTPDPPGFTGADSSFSRHPGLFYGLLWWGFAGPGGPPDTFASGLFGQVLYVARARRVVLLRTGWDDGGVPFWPALLRDLAAALPLPEAGARSGSAPA